MTPTVLTIAGLDPYGGAGIQVDSKVIHALGGYAFCVTTALTAQNSTGVRGVFVTPIEHFKLQLETLLEDIEVDAVKIGMLANVEIIDIVVKMIQKYKLKNIVLDTVLVSSSGRTLLEPSAVGVMVKELFPLVDIITPNIPEVNTLLGTSYKGSFDDIPIMAKGLFDLGAKAVLIKGGHSQERENSTDYFVLPLEAPVSYVSPRLYTTHTHGTGCVLSSAIAIGLAKSETICIAIQNAKDFIYEKLYTSDSMKFKYYHENSERKEPLL